MRYEELLEELLNKGEDYASASKLAMQIVRSEQYYKAQTEDK